MITETDHSLHISVSSKHRRLQWTIRQGTSLPAYNTFSLGMLTKDVCKSSLPEEMSEKKTRTVNCRLMVIVGSLTFLFLIVIFSIVGFNVKRVSRVSKRSILAICDMIHTYTNRSCTDFNQYGCFCGIGSHGSKPLDAIDRCCYDHDLCYGSFHCHWFYYPFVPYDYSCNSDYCICTSNPKMCGSIICECDIQLSECFAHNAHLYNRRMKNIDANKC